MADILKYAATDTNLLGLATIGGLVALLILAVRLTVSATKFARNLRGPLAKSNLTAAKQVAKEFRISRKLRKLGVSDVAIAGYEIRQASILITMFILSCAMATSSMAIDDKGIRPALFAFLMIYSSNKFVAYIRTATRKIQYSSSPILFYHFAKREMRSRSSIFRFIGF